MEPEESTNSTQRNVVDTTMLLSLKIVLERSELRSDIRKDSARAKNYQTARNNLASWLEEVQPSRSVTG